MPLSIHPAVTLNATVIVWIVRAGPRHFRYGDPYDTCCVVVREGDSRVEVEALAGGPLKLSDFREMQRLMLSEGVLEITWVRRRPDGSVHRAQIWTQ